ncbi:GM26914 [Drosophila sechellia]|uniref:GM26914 n=1 Tax=Drosophila sechellia TaxID=7238 RepID=B4IHW4_DROSE|nr:GM26914 [Drosophila sechellia]
MIIGSAMMMLPPLVCVAYRNSGVPDFLGDLSGISPMRRRHHPRGTRRGRPRGSTRRGGGHGSVPRVLTPTQAATPAVPATATQAAAAGTSSPLPQQEVSGGGDNAGVPLNEEEYRTSPSGQSAGVSCKRGPGRPRSKTATPVSRGTRGAPRARRPMGPLLVPLGRSPDDTPPGSSPATSRAPSPSAGSHGAVGPE